MARAPMPFVGTPPAALPAPSAFCRCFCRPTPFVRMLATEPAAARQLSYRIKGLPPPPRCARVHPEMSYVIAGPLLETFGASSAAQPFPRTAAHSRPWRTVFSANPCAREIAPQLTKSRQKHISFAWRVEKFKCFKTNQSQNFYSLFVAGRFAGALPVTR